MVPKRYPSGTQVVTKLSPSGHQVIQAPTLQMSSRYQHCLEHRNTSKKQIATYLTIWVEILFSHWQKTSLKMGNEKKWESCCQLRYEGESSTFLPFTAADTIARIRQFSPWLDIFWLYVKVFGVPSINQSNAKTNRLYPSIITIHYPQYKNSQGNLRSQQRLQCIDIYFNTN